MKNSCQKPLIFSNLNLLSILPNLASLKFALALMNMSSHMLLAFLLIEIQQYVTNQEQIIHKTFPDCAKLCLLVPLYVCCIQYNAHL